MFDSIRGLLKSSAPTRAVVEAAGIGYEVHLPLSTYESMGKVGEEATLLLHLVVRENEWRLFGFATEGERNVFRALLRVNGVGPVMALSLLSGLKPAEFRVAVTKGDVRSLTRVKGIGKKTAERIVVELRDVVGADGADGALAGVDGAASSAVVEDAVEDAVKALMALGLDLSEARRRVEKHAGADLPVSELVRRALRG